MEKIWNIFVKQTPAWKMAAILIFYVANVLFLENICTKFDACITNYKI